MTKLFFTFVKKAWNTVPEQDKDIIFKLCTVREMDFSDFRVDPPFFAHVQLIKSVCNLIAAIAKS